MEKTKLTYSQEVKQFVDIVVDTFKDDLEECSNLEEVKSLYQNNLTLIEAFCDEEDIDPNIFLEEIDNIINVYTEGLNNQNSVSLAKKRKDFLSLAKLNGLEIIDISYEQASKLLIELSSDNFFDESNTILKLKDKKKEVLDILMYSDFYKLLDINESMKKHIKDSIQKQYETAFNKLESKSIISFVDTIDNDSYLDKYKFN
jgi:hypothetical protein